MTDQPESSKPTIPSGGPSFFGARMPERLGCYRLESVLGKGGMGLVIKAWDENLDRPVALKVISPDYLQHEDSLIRLQSEAKAAAQMVHQNIVSVYSFGKEGEWPYIAMEYIEGQDLSAWIKNNGALSSEKAVGYIRQAAEALSYAANRSVVHRDIKPANLMLANDGTLKVMDFGIAKRLDVDLGLTASGAILGTPDYMSPEQTLGHQLDFRSDMYSLGLTLFTLIKGSKPFIGDTPFKVMHCHVNEPLPIPREWDALASGRLVAVLEKMTEKDPEDRYDSWDSLINELYQIEVTFFGSASVSAPQTLITPGRGGANSYVQPAPKQPGKGLKLLVVGAVLLALMAVVGAGAVMFFGGGGTPPPSPLPLTNSTSTKMQVSSVVPKVSLETIVTPVPVPTQYIQQANRPQTRPVGNARQKPGMNRANNRPGPPMAPFLKTLNNPEKFLQALNEGQFTNARQLLQDRTQLRGPQEQVLRPMMMGLDRGLQIAENFDQYLSEGASANPTREEKIRLAEGFLKARIPSGTEKEKVGTLIYLFAIGADSAAQWENEIKKTNPNFPDSEEFRRLLDTMRALHQAQRSSLFQ
jgi:serine/threonine protein kinase